MIKQNTIDEVRSRMDIYEVISNYVKLKKSGSGFTGLCPFHDEKTGSFHVSSSKQIYKCFGCGKSGDGIRFIMEHDKKTFAETIEYLAQQYNITVEYDQQSQEQSAETKDKKKELVQLISWAQKKYEDLLFSLPDDAPVHQYLSSRHYSRDRMRSWSLGFAPDSWDFIKTPLINLGKFEPATHCGLIHSSSGKSYDFFRNRIIIPIHDHNGILIGLAGRLVPGADPEKEKSIPKYLNPCESLAYSKKKVWYGLWQAQKAIRDQGFAYIVEGYMDVQALHDVDICNTVASCGTEIDQLQVNLLKRYTRHVVICYDGDNAGTDKMMKQINLFLLNDFKVEVIELPEGQDPDVFIHEFDINRETAVAE